MRARSLMDAGHSALTSLAMTCGEDRELAVTATGTTTADAYVLKAGMTQFTTVGAGTGARIPTTDLAPGDEFFVYNGGANALLVYPPTGGTVNAAGVDAGNSLAAGAGALYKMMTSLAAMRVG